MTDDQQMAVISVIIIMFIKWDPVLKGRSVIRLPIPRKVRLHLWHRKSSFFFLLLLTNSFIKYCRPPLSLSPPQITHWRNLTWILVTEFFTKTRLPSHHSIETIPNLPCWKRIFVFVVNQKIYIKFYCVHKIG